MANGDLPYQVARPPAPNFAIPPELVERMAKAQAAKSQLGAMDPRIAALRQQSQMQMPKGYSHGDNFVAANPLEFIGKALSSHAAGKKLSDAEAQAQALRGDVQGGAGAQQEHAAAQAQARAQAQADQQYAAAQTRASRDQYLQEQRDAELQARLNQRPTERMFGRSVEKDIAKNKTALYNVQDVVEVAANLTPDDLATIDKPFQNILLNAAPKDIETYIQNNVKDLTPNGRRFVELVSLFDAKERNALFGSALTRGESGLSKGFLAGAPGLLTEDMLRRMKSMARGKINVLRGYEATPGVPRGYLTEEFDNVFEGGPWEAKKEEPAPAAAPIAPAGIPNFDAMNDAELEEYVKSGGNI